MNQISLSVQSPRLLCFPRSLFRSFRYFHVHRHSWFQQPSWFLERNLTRNVLMSCRPLVTSFWVANSAYRPISEIFPLNCLPEVPSVLIVTSPPTAILSTCVSSTSTRT